MPAKLRRVVIESPFAGDVALNLRYLRACLRDSLRLGEAPFASHGLYTQPGVLDDLVPAERELGIRAGLEWARKAHCTVVYVDLGFSNGMREGIDHARDMGRTIEQRCLPSDVFKRVLHDEYKAREPDPATSTLIDEAESKAWRLERKNERLRNALISALDHLGPNEPITKRLRLLLATASDSHPDMCPELIEDGLLCSLHKGHEGQCSP